MSGSVVFDNTLPYQFSRDPERMYAQVPMRRDQPSYRVVAPGEQAYIPVDQGYGFRPREQGFVPVHHVPEEHFYGLNPRGREQLYRPVQRSAPYLAPQVVPQEQAYRMMHPSHQPYGPVGGRGRQPMVEVVPMRDNGHGLRQAYGPVLLPREQVWDSRGQYGGRPSDSSAFQPVYGGVGFDEPEPLADAQLEEDRAPYYLVRAPSRQRGGRPVFVDDASGVPYIVAGGRGMEENEISPRGSGNGRGLVRNIPVKDAFSIPAAQNEGTKAKDDQKRRIEGDTKQGLLKKGFLAPGNAKSRSTSERGEPDQESGLLRKGFLTAQSKKGESLATAAPNRSAVSGNGQSDSEAGKVGRVITVPISDAENGNLDKVMKAIFNALKEGSKPDGEKNSEERRPKASTPKEPDHLSAEKDLIKTGPAAESPEPAVNDEGTRTSGGGGVTREEQSDAKNDQLQSSSGEAGKCEGEHPVKKTRIGEEEAAKKIQAAFKGYSLRRTNPIEKARAIAKVRAKLRELEEQVANGEAFGTLMKDPKERLKLTEGLMALFLQLDAIQGVHPTVRDLRKSVARGLTRLQDDLDSKLREILVSDASSDEAEKTAPEGNVRVAGDCFSSQEAMEEGEGVAECKAVSGSSVEQATENSLLDVEGDVDERVDPAEETARWEHEEGNCGKSVVEGAPEFGAKLVPVAESAAECAAEAGICFSPDTSSLEGAVEGLEMTGKEDMESHEVEEDSAVEAAQDSAEILEQDTATCVPEVVEAASGGQQNEVAEGADEGYPQVLLEDDAPEGSSWVVVDREAPVDLDSLPEAVKGMAVTTPEEVVAKVGSPTIVEGVTSVDSPAETVDGSVAEASGGQLDAETCDEGVGERPADIGLPGMLEDDSAVTSVPNAMDGKSQSETGSNDESSTEMMPSIDAPADSIVMPETHHSSVSSCDERLVGTERNVEGNVVAASNVTSSCVAAAGGGLERGGDTSTGESAVAEPRASASVEEDGQLHPASHADQEPGTGSFPACEPQQRSVFEGKKQLPSPAHDERGKPSAQEVEEEKLMWQLIEENRQLKAMVQTLVGLSESQTRSIVDRLNRLESRVSESGKARERPARRVVARRRK